MKMTQSDFIRKLYSFTPNTPYGELLKNEFNVDVPVAAPEYQQEYLYKYCLELSMQDNLNDKDIVQLASTKVYELIKKYPWCKTKYDTVIVHKEKMVKTDFKDMEKDNITVFSKKHKKYMFYKDNTIVCRSNTVEGLKKVVARRFGLDFKLNLDVLSV